MSEQDVSTGRRRLLQGASIAGLAVLLSGCPQSGTREGGTAADLESDEECAKPGTRGAPSDEELNAIADELWGQFDKGLLIGSKNPNVALADGVKDNRHQHHAEKVVENWSTLTRCRRLTGQCAFNTGVVAGVLARQTGAVQVTTDMFILAATAVFEMQKNRAGGGGTFSGIAC